MNPQYPIYIVSKGRHKSRLTVKALDRMRVPYQIVVEPQEFDLYAAVIDPARILVLPFSNLGQGSIPARNWIWDHASTLGVKRYWILDDNIRAFYRMYKNKKYYASNGTLFRCAEDFVDRYTNVALAGFQYKMFFPKRSWRPPFVLNKRIYSCILILTDLPYRWRGRYNEDTDLSLRVLKDGWCTILFYAFLADKVGTMTLAGGNTDLYRTTTNHRYEFAKSLQEQHPDVVKVGIRYQRFHHIVNYEPFRRNKLIRRSDIDFNAFEKVDEYGMIVGMGDQQKKQT